jgi:hypothetical protein
VNPLQKDADGKPIPLYISKDNVDFNNPRKGLDPKAIVFKPLNVVCGAVMLFAAFGFTAYVWRHGDGFVRLLGVRKGTAELMSMAACAQYIGCGLLFGCFGYVWDPNLFFLAPNFFNLGRDIIMGQKHTFLTYGVHANMFRAAIASVDDPKAEPEHPLNNKHPYKGRGDKYTNGVAANAIFAITIKLRAECLFWWCIAITSMTALVVDFKHRALLHFFHAIFAWGIMCIDLNHWLPGSLGVPFPFGWNNHVTGIGRFIGWSLGPLWFPTFIFSLCAMYWSTRLDQED